MNKKREFFTYAMKRKLVFLFFIFITALGLLTGRIYKIVKAEGEKYEKNVLKQQVNNLVRYNQLIEPKRGTIYDRNGRVFAESKKVYHIIFDPGVLSRCDKEDVQETIDFLVEGFGLNASELQDLVDNKSYSNYELVAKNLDYNNIEKEYQAIKSRRFKGVYLQEVYNRYYPGDNMLSDVLGFVNKNNEGVWGVEESYEENLRGEVGREFGVINEGYYIRNNYMEPKNGHDVVLTIDQTLQYYMEQAIKDNLETDPQNVYAIAMNPQNGEVLAMASYPNFDLNKPYDLEAFFSKEELDKMSMEKKGEFLNRLWRNFNIADVYEPGSTFKPFVLAMALEEKKVSLNSKYMCKGFKRVGGWRITCWESRGHGEQTLVEALENSCNVAFMDIGEAIGYETFDRYLQLFGFRDQTNIDLVGEGDSVMHEEGSMRVTDLATSSFGQSFNITPTQLISAFSSLINGGYLYEPHVVKKIVNAGGNVVSATTSKQVRQTISAETAQYVKEALRSVVANGTGKGVQVAGYDIGGKSGTAEKLPRNAFKYMVSFMGFAPVDNPELLMLVIVDEPDVKKPRSIYAQNIMKQIMENALPYMNIYPRTGETVEPLIFQIGGEEDTVDGPEGTNPEGAPEDGATEKDATGEGNTQEGNTQDGEETQGQGSDSTQETPPAPRSEVDGVATMIDESASGTTTENTDDNASASDD